jgi:predicted PurR-regulated permease PerM
LDDFDDFRVARKLKNSSIPFVILLCFSVILGGVVLWPLSGGLAWAAVLSYLSYPVYRFLHERVLRGRYSFLAAGVNTALILFLLVIPMLGAGIRITREIGRAYQFLVEWIPEARSQPLGSLLPFPQLDWLFSMFPIFRDTSLWSDLASMVPRLLASFMSSMSRELVGNAFRLVFNLLVMTVGMFFLTKDGRLLLQFISDILPLQRSDKEAFFKRSRQMLSAIFYGIMLTAGVQGLLGGIGWRYVGLPSPLLFGSLMAFLAMFPFVGTPIVWAPGAIYLFANGDVKGGVILFLWGGLVVSCIDNFLRPFFISEGSKAHILLVFAGVLGGLSVWGFLGLFMGPLILSLAYFMLHLYRLIISAPDGA